MEQKICIVCGNVNNSRSENFCSEKCHQKWYYNKNKEKLLERHREWGQKNRENMKDYHNEYNKKYYQEHKEKLKEYSREVYRKRKELKENDYRRSSNKINRINISKS